MSSNLVPLKIRRVGGVMHVKPVENLNRRLVGVVWKLGGCVCQLRCRPRHLTMVQNYDVHHQKASSS
ncbi:hypothetical protein TNCV_4021511 [Trichonephila clavipes]|nr:hypothetical protein TNCV_4021511 [Trichonephila clavipes]